VAKSRHRRRRIAAGKQVQASGIVGCRGDRCRPERTADLLELSNVLRNGVEVSGSESDLDGSGQQFGLNERTRLDIGQCPLDGEVGTRGVALRQPKQRHTRLGRTAELMCLPEGFLSTLQVADSKPHFADRVLGLTT
jgi:hypothetical protein